MKSLPSISIGILVLAGLAPVSGSSGSLDRAGAGAAIETRVSDPSVRPAPGIGATGDGAAASIHRGGPQETVRVDGDRLLGQLSRLAELGGTEAGGTHRVAYSPEDLAAREYVTELMTAAGLEVHVDLVGNLVGRRPGTESGLARPSHRAPAARADLAALAGVLGDRALRRIARMRLGPSPTAGAPHHGHLHPFATAPDEKSGLAPLMLGSHIDSVPRGGRFDGQVGSLAAIEVARTLAEHGIRTRHPLEVVIFQNEEGGKTGSRAWISELEPEELDIVTATGRTIREGIRLLGGDPDRLDEARRRPGSVAAYLELHVEQGAVLETEAVEIGVVEGIVGIKRWTVTVEGFANHAGTTPMDARRDALVAAARFIQQVNRVARETPGRQVATVGRIEASPGAPNVIPGEVTMSLEVRDLQMDKIDAIYRQIRDEAATIEGESDVGFSFDRFYVSRAAPTDERIRELVAEAAAELDLSSLHLPSGAGHDAQSVARLAPVGMIFIPSVGGISHSPREFSEPEDVVAGADVLLRTLLKLDRADWLGR